MAFTVQLVNEEYASDVTRIGKSSFREAFASVTPAEELEKYLEIAYRPEAQRRELNHPSMYTLMAFNQDNAPIGFCQLKTNGQVPNAVEDAQAIEVYRLYIDQSFSGKGAGKTLMEHAMIKAKELGKKTVWLEVLESNISAMGLYNKLGFQKVGSSVYPLSEKEVVKVMIKNV